MHFANTILTINIHTNMERIKYVKGQEHRTDDIIKFLISQGATDNGDWINEYHYEFENPLKIFYVNNNGIVRKNVACVTLTELMEEYVLDRWRAEIGESYHYIDHCGDIQISIDTRRNCDNLLYAKGNYFQYRDDAIQFRAEAVGNKFKVMSNKQ